MFLLRHVREPVRPRCKRATGDLWKRCLSFNNRARKALSLLLVPATDGDKLGTPVVAEKLFDQMEIYPGMLFVRTDLPETISEVEQVLRRHISASYTKQQGYPTLRWSVLRAYFSSTLIADPQLFFDDEIRNKEVESLGKRPVTCVFAPGTGSGFVFEV